MADRQEIGATKAERHPPQDPSCCLCFQQAPIRDRKPALQEWPWQLSDAIDETDNVPNKFEYMKHIKQLIKNKKQTKARSIIICLKKTVGHGGMENTAFLQHVYKDEMAK
ncbi:hypothetical protein IEQ34_007546 [Dendrobium chrysotoxum]|uniref:Uncharacterized protein n=1 Tax=Dendrobium chrysotoxum TaxID=161865 RepID=A0AAV7H595_DENCH|nr:hypothetical protein IEQ34_007546 [Dendrobium chrysotoxum]